MLEKKTNSNWILRPENQAGSKVKLFCFPYAGGGPSIFRRWIPLRESDFFDLHILQMPGRERKINEAQFKSMDSLVDSILPEIIELIDLPFAFYGHSMGALIAYEVTRQLEKKYNCSPDLLFVGGRQAPNFVDIEQAIHLLSSGDFIEQMHRRYNGIPLQILENRELWDILIPPLKADIELIFNYSCPKIEKINAPILAFTGDHDIGVNAKDVRDWQLFTNKSFELEMINGSHFFMNESPKALLAIMEEKCKNLNQNLRAEKVLNKR